MKERNRPACNGGDKLYFKYRDRSATAEQLRMLSTSATCHNQWHVRIWGDYDINPSAPGQWSVATVHYERKNHQHNPLSGHTVVKDWELSENRTMYELQENTSDESRYCGQNDYRPFPGQRPGRDSRGLYNNGRISRLSIQKPSIAQPYGSNRCAGS